MLDEALSPWQRPGFVCGVDAIEIERVRRALHRWETRFLERVYTEREVGFCRGRVPELAVRFAGKEAVSKALGTGMYGVSWREIEILPNRRGRPELYLHARALARAQALKLTDWAISLSHSRDTGLAFVVARESP